MYGYRKLHRHNIWLEFVLNGYRINEVTSVVDKMRKVNAAVLLLFIPNEIWLTDILYWCWSEHGVA